MAAKIKKTEFVGTGALVQLIGVVLCFVAFPLGLLAGIVAIIIGGRMSIYFCCQSCGNKVAKESKMCPTCRSSLS